MKGRRNITVTSPTTLTANIVLTAGATINGYVTVADTAVGLTDYGAYVYSADNPEIRANAVRVFATSSFNAQGLRPGHYVLVVYPSGINATLLCGQAAPLQHHLYLPLVRR